MNENDFLLILISGEPLSLNISWFIDDLEILVKKLKEFIYYHLLMLCCIFGYSILCVICATISKNFVKVQALSIVCATILRRGPEL